MKRAIIFLILFFMILHCSVRLGFATWLYQNRQSIAFSFGFTDERPITMCSHEHDLDRAVMITVHHDETDKIPVNVLQVREINLFIQIAYTQGTPRYSLLRENQVPRVVESDYPIPSIDIFHPPA